MIRGVLFVFPSKGAFEGFAGFVSISPSLVSISFRHCAILWNARGQGKHASERKQHKLSQFNVSGRSRRALFSRQSAMQ